MSPLHSTGHDTHALSPTHFAGMSAAVLMAAIGSAHDGGSQKKGAPGGDARRPEFRCFDAALLRRRGTIACIPAAQSRAPSTR